MEREWGSAAIVALAHLVTDQCTGGCTAHGAQRAAEQGIPHDTTGHGAYAGTDLCTAGIGGTAGREQGNGCCNNNKIKTAGSQALLALEAVALARGVSPGGAADLLAATLFLDRLTEGEAHGNA